MPKEIIFHERTYPELEKEETLPVDELESLDVIDVNRYKKL